MRTKPLLVVEEARYSKHAASETLRQFEAATLSVSSVEAALELLRATPIGLLVVDFETAGISGFECLRRAREIQPRLRIVVISAEATATSVAGAMQLGAVDFIEKPYPPPALRAMVSLIYIREEIDGDLASDYDELVELAKRQTSDGDYLSAEESALRAVSRSPQRPEGYELLGSLAEIEGDVFRAKDFYRLALGADATLLSAERKLDHLSQIDAVLREDNRADHPDEIPG